MDTPEAVGTQEEGVVVNIRFNRKRNAEYYFDEKKRFLQINPI